MAHDKIYDMIKKAVEEKDGTEEREKILGEIYELVDEYNGFIKNMDKKFDKVVIKLEAFIEDGY